MFNIIRRAITGYKAINMSKNGIEIKISYRGKRPSSDPLSILKEVKVKLSQASSATPVSLDISKCWNERLGLLKSNTPSYTAKFQIDNRIYTISRFVTKQNRSPLSLYTFSNKDKIFAIFFRVYDYGDFFKEVENELITNYNFKKPESALNFHYIANEKYAAVLDVFGHSQSFFWNDKDELDKCLEGINL